MKLVVFGQALLHEPVAWNTKVREIAEGADAILCNFEGCLPPPDAWPMKRKTVHPAGPAALMDLKRLGVTHLALANNHIWDFGHAGIVVTRRAAEAAGFAVAGAGIDRDQARRPAIRNGVALVSVDAGPTPDWAIARAHPGVAALRVRRVLGLPRRDLDLLTEISTDSGEAERLARRRNIGFDAAVAPPLGLDVIEAPVRQEILSINDDDLDRLCRDIVAARAEADKVIVAVHYHQWAPDWMRAPDWFTTLTDKALAAGADAVTGTGPPPGRSRRSCPDAPWRLRASAASPFTPDEPIATTPCLCRSGEAVRSYSRMGDGPSTTSTWPDPIRRHPTLESNDAAHMLRIFAVPTGHWSSRPGQGAMVICNTRQCWRLKC